MLKDFAAIVLIVFSWPTVVRAQEASDDKAIRAQIELSTSQEQELKIWLKAMIEWQKFDKQWNNKIAHRNNGTMTTRRKYKPDEPPWLRNYCQSAVVLSKTGENACLMIFKPELVLVDDNVVKSSFWTRVHFDLVGTQTMFGGSKSTIIGLGGLHITLVDIGRLQFYGPPGAILVRVPNQQGKYQYKPGYTWGMSIRLTDFRFPGSPKEGGKNASLFINLTKCWVTAQSVAGVQTQGMDFVTFSISPRKR